jgi:RimJ/RimL family protein N-acetyltransferase
LTAEKVMGWKKSGGEAFVLVKGGEGSPVGYGEINPMRKGGEYLWLGHVVVRPDQRGRGMGSTLLRALLVEAFERRNAALVALIVFPDNLAALRCYRRAGFSQSGEEIHQFDGAGPTHRLLRMEITRPPSFPPW